MATDRKSELIVALEKLRQQEVANKAPFKARAYQVVAKQIAAFDGPIHTFDDIKDLKGIGKSIALKLQELFDTGKVQRIEDESKTIESINDLLRIHGIGPVKAKDLVENHKIMCIADLESKQDLLNEKQKMGLKYYKDFEKRIPRKEMDKHNEYIIETIKAIDPKLRVVIAGSYRRQLPDSGDIDVLITHEDDPEDYEPLFKLIIAALKKNYISDLFAEGGKKSMAVCKLKRHRTFRRLDLLYTRKHEHPFALLYFTGSGDFNVEMRNVALAKGYSLSEYGLKYMDGPNKGKFVEGEHFEEEDIFEFLKIKYVEPKNRKKM